MITRRQFIFSSVLFFTGFLPFNYKRPVLRPPGARRDFLGRCIRCGMCIEACPYDSLRAMDITSGAQAHTPYIDPLRTPCYLCQERGPDGQDRPISEFLRCGEVCPTGAIRKIENNKDVLARVPEEMKIGLSVLNRNICLAWQYDSCGECYYNCPLKDRALRDFPPDMTFPDSTGIRPWVDPKYCIGCGMCNYVCPVKEKVARAVMRRDYKLTMFEARYAAMVRNLIGRAPKGTKLPAIRVVLRP